MTRLLHRQQRPAQQDEDWGDVSLCPEDDKELLPERLLRRYLCLFCEKER